MSKGPRAIDYVPVSGWPDASDWTVNFDEYLMPSSNKLAKEKFVLVFEDGKRIFHEFHDNAKTLTWKIEGEGQSTHKDEDSYGTNEYKAFEVRPDTFFVDFYKTGYYEVVTLVLNIATGQALCAISELDNSGSERRTKTTLLNARISDHENAKPFPPTDGLVGKHILYRYTPRDLYEHFYLNRGTFTWHCVEGTEKGLADTEPTKVLSLGEDLYLLFWTETVMPVESLIVIDLKQMRTTGRFYCWDVKQKRDVHKRFGAYATILGQSNIDEVLASL